MVNILEQNVHLFIYEEYSLRMGFLVYSKFSMLPPAFDKPRSYNYGLSNYLLAAIEPCRGKPSVVKTHPANANSLLLLKLRTIVIPKVPNLRST